MKVDSPGQAGMPWGWHLPHRTHLLQCIPPAIRQTLDLVYSRVGPFPDLLDNLQQAKCAEVDEGGAWAAQFLRGSADGILGRPADHPSCFAAPMSMCSILRVMQPVWVRLGAASLPQKAAPHPQGTLKNL